MFNSPRFSNRFLLPLMLLKLINLATINWYFQISILMNFLCPSSLSFMLSCDNYHIWITLTTTTLSFTAMKIIRGWSPYTCFVLISVFHFFILYFYYLFSNYYYFSFFYFSFCHGWLKLDLHNPLWTIFFFMDSKFSQLLYFYFFLPRQNWCLREWQSVLSILLYLNIV